MKPNFTNGQSINAADIVKDIIFYEIFRRIKINAFLVILMIYARISTTHTSLWTQPSSMIFVPASCMQRFLWVLTLTFNDLLQLAHTTPHLFTSKWLTNHLILFIDIWHWGWKLMLSHRWKNSHTELLFICLKCFLWERITCLMRLFFLVSCKPTQKWLS